MCFIGCIGLLQKQCNTGMFQSCFKIKEVGDSCLQKRFGVYLAIAFK